MEVSEEQLRKIVDEQVRKTLALKAEMGNHLAADLMAPHPTGTAQHDALHNEKTKHVQVIVAARGIPGASGGEVFPGIGCAHRYWLNGTTDAWVTERQFADLKAHAGGLQVVDLGELEAKAKAELEAAVAAELELRTAPAVDASEKPKSDKAPEKGKSGK